MNLQNLFKINKDLLMALFILLLPFAFYIYNIAPETKTWKTSLFKIDSGAFENVNYFLWFLCVKLLALIMITLWYLTCIRKWRIVLLIAITFEIYKFISLIKTVKLGIEFEGISVVETLCYSTPYIIVLLFISKKLNYYEAYNSDLAPLSNEINNEMLKLSKFDKEQYKSVEKELKVLDAQKLNMDKKEYLTKLITLRDQLTISN